MNEGLLIFILVLGAIIEIAFLVVFFRMAANISKMSGVRKCTYASIQILVYLGEKERAKELVLSTIQRHTDEFYEEHSSIDESLSYFKSELKKHCGREMELVGLDIDKIPNTPDIPEESDSESV